MNAADPSSSAPLLAALAEAEAVWGRYEHVATRYLQSRGINTYRAATLPFGYAPSSACALTEHLLRLGFHKGHLLQLGLSLQTRRGNLIDRFRGRVMFPLRHPTSGLTVGAIGRDLTGRSSTAKYLNSPASDLYNKSELLYGLAEQRHRLTAGAVPILVEGPTDALAIAATNTELVPIASCGTALTPQHVAALREHSTSETILVAYDGDRPGQQAAANAYQLLRPAFTNSRWLELPAGIDPGDAFTRTAPDSLQTLPLADAVIAAELGQQPTTTSPDLIMAIKRAGRAVATLHPDDWQHEISKISRRLDVDPVTIQQQVVQTTHVARGG
jgi:DNA primase